MTEETGIVRGVDRAILKDRWVKTPQGETRLFIDPKWEADWEAAKATRDISENAPHVKRFKELLVDVKEWAKAYEAQGITFKVVTNLRGYIDAQSATEEPELVAKKRAHRTMAELRPNKFKFSDIDMAAFKGGVALTNAEIEMLFKTDPQRHEKARGLILRTYKGREYRIDVYESKGAEEQFAFDL